MNKQLKLFPEEEPKVVATMDLKDAEKIAFEIKALVEPFCVMLAVAGSIRRQKTQVHDIDFVVVTKSDVEWHRLREELKRLKVRSNCSGNKVIKALLPCQEGLFQIDFYRAKPSTFGIHLLIRTGSAEHNMWLAGHAVLRGMRLKYSEGLLKDGVAVAGDDEKGVFEALSLPCPLPREREIVENIPVWFHSKNQDRA